MPGEQNGVGAKCQGNAGECRRMPGEHVRVGAKCQGNARECHRNLRQWVKSARGMQGNIGKYQGNILGACKPPEECREMPGECKGVGELPRGMQGNAAECSQENVWK